MVINGETGMTVINGETEWELMVNECTVQTGVIVHTSELGQSCVRGSGVGTKMVYKKSPVNIS